MYFCVIFWHIFYTFCTNWSLRVWVIKSMRWVFRVKTTFPFDFFIFNYFFLHWCRRHESENVWNLQPTKTQDYFRPSLISVIQDWWFVQFSFSKNVAFRSTIFFVFVWQIKYYFPTKHNGHKNDFHRKSLNCFCLRIARAIFEFRFRWIQVNKSSFLEPTVALCIIATIS